ncbi:MAG: pentapeptide repeat-containing protein [Acidimicrobiia bacterium]|nr:pentapeptide repeat-containing protein [Acidimicrobiia bacterium]
MEGNRRGPVLAEAADQLVYEGRLSRARAAADPYDVSHDRTPYPGQPVAIIHRSPFSGGVPEIPIRSRIDEHAQPNQRNTTRESNLRRANPRRANPRRANLRGANLRRANLRRANLRRANPRRAMP